jgi:hypothetical protein
MKWFVAGDGNFFRAAQREGEAQEEVYCSGVRDTSDE